MSKYIFLIFFCLPITMLISGCSTTETDTDYGTYKESIWVPIEKQKQADSEPSRLLKEQSENLSENPEYGNSDNNNDSQNYYKEYYADEYGRRQGLDYSQDSATENYDRDEYYSPAYPSYAETESRNRYGNYQYENEMSSRYAKPVQTIDTNKPTLKIALLLPLSGEKENIGQAMLNAAQMALFDVGGDFIEILPKDTEGNPKIAAEASIEAAREDAQVIIGPLFSESAKAVKPVLYRYGLDMITFSTDWTLADRRTYVMGILPFAQIARIVSYAKDAGYKRIGIISSENSYGRVVTQAFKDMAENAGLEITGHLPVDPLQRNLSSMVGEFADYDNRVKALEYRIGYIESQLKKNPGNAALIEEMKKLENMSSFGEMPFDAIFFPIGGRQAVTIANLLSSYDLDTDKVPRIGTGLWDDTALAGEPHLDGSVFAAPSPKVRKNFEQRYSEIYGDIPPRLASLAYDATALIASVSRSNSNYDNSGSYVFNIEDLKNPNGFAGVDGIFRFRENGLVERGLSLLQYKNGRIIEIDPSPSTFQNYSALMSH